MEKENLLSQILLVNNENAGAISSKRVKSEQIDKIIKISLKLNIVLNEYVNVSIANLSGVIVYVSDSLCVSSMYKKQELIGNTHKKISSNSHEKQYIKILWDTISKGKTWKGELKNKKKDGTFFWHDTIIHPLKDKNGNILEFVSLSRDITKPKELEQQLKDALKEKDMLMSELHHRVKNNFAILVAILKMKFGANEKNNIIAQDIESKIVSMVALHETLYKNENLSEVPARELIDKISSNITSIYSNTVNVKLNTEITEDICFDVDNAMSLSLIINEILTNSCKHAFPEDENCKVNIILVKLHPSSHYSLEISDNGIGFDQSEVLQDSFGNILIKMLIEDQLKGSYEVFSTNGTKYRIKLPKKIISCYQNTA